MIKYASIINEETKLVSVGIGSDETFYKSIGMTPMDVEPCTWEGTWYLKGFVPPQPEPKEPTTEEKVQLLEQKYNMNRWQREGILAEGSLYSEYTKAHAQEIEDLAEELRK